MEIEGLIDELSITKRNSQKVANAIAVRRSDGGIFNYTTLNGYRVFNTENNREYGVKGRYTYGEIKPTNAKVYQNGALIDPVIVRDNIGSGYRIPLKGEVVGGVKGFMTTDEFTDFEELLRECNLGNNTVENGAPYSVESSYGVDFQEIGKENYSLDKANSLPKNRNHRIAPFFDGWSQIWPNLARNTMGYSYFQEVDGEQKNEVQLKETSTSMNSSVYLDNYAFASNLLKKTNKLFKEGKIKSLVNRFHSDKVLGDETTTAYDKIYGLSRGRNLLKKNPQEEIDKTGYTNPYCRVWTAHYQYSKLKDRIRPFYEGDNPMDLESLHKKMGGLRTANGPESLKNNSVLRKDGFVQITPQHKDGKKDENIKNFMFSIENLAWKDTIKTSGLYPSQIGPNKGRIMWFPPYNLKFSENVSTQWNSHNFIGRGEQIYTYVNTERSGTLSFTLLIDHPSLINRWRGTSGVIGSGAADDKTDAEQDLLRFFAGCGMLEDPLTGTDNKAVKEQPAPQEKIEEERNGKQIDNIVKKPVTRTKQIAYVVFFPNDFSCRDYYTKEEMFKAINRLTKYEAYGDGHWTERDGSYANEYLYKDNIVNTDSGEFLNIEPESDVKIRIRELLFNGDKSIEIRYFIGKPGNENKGLIGTLNSSETEYVGGLASKEGIGGTSLFGIGGDSGESQCKIDSIFVKGFASSHGYESNNIELCKRRRAFIKELLIHKSPKVSNIKFIEEETDKEVKSGIIAIDKVGEHDDVNLLSAKIARAAIAIFNVSYKEDDKPVNTPSEEDVRVANGVALPTNEPNIPQNNASSNIVSTNTEIDLQKYTADAEYLYFAELDSNEMIHKDIVDKIRFFDPAFHSITPEGFNARLTFLHQCTRQGPTNEISNGKVDSSSSAYTKFAGNLSFGRAPYCILRIGDFYHTKICIDSLSIDYDNGGIQWDLNPEGAGVQPMFANVNINFKFIGGQDLDNPVERLQNAISSNYYANASVYDKNAVQKNKKDK